MFLHWGDGLHRWILTCLSMVVSTTNPPPQVRHPDLLTIMKPQGHLHHASMGNWRTAIDRRVNPSAHLSNIKFIRQWYSAMLRLPPILRLQVPTCLDYPQAKITTCWDYPMIWLPHAMITCNSMLWLSQCWDYPHAEITVCWDYSMLRLPHAEITENDY